jgi:hypothetical protein
MHFRISNRIAMCAGNRTLQRWPHLNASAAGNALMGGFTITFFRSAGKFDFLAMNRPEEAVDPHQ